MFKSKKAEGRILVAPQHDRGGRERILDAARMLFAAHGFHQTPMAELATAAQVSVGQIYRLFKGKEDIIDAIVENDRKDREALLLDLRRRLDAGEMDIERTFELLFLDVMREDKEEALSFDILAEAFRNPRVGGTIREFCAFFRQLLGELACVANPDLSGDALKGAQEMILACLFGLGHRTLSATDLSPELVAAQAARMTVAALRSMD